jgi:hypothetical protein
MDWQTLAVLLVVLTATTYLVSRIWRRRPNASCGGSCGCSRDTSVPVNGRGQETFVPVEKLSSRLSITGESRQDAT